LPGAAVELVFAELGREWIRNAGKGRTAQVSLTRSMMLGALRGTVSNRRHSSLESRRNLRFRFGRLPLGILQFALDLLDLYSQLLHWTLHAVDLI
jgi:hypothetical protein